jgi:hypothetical protein
VQFPEFGDARDADGLRQALESRIR